MNLDFDTIEIPEEKLNRTIQNNIKKVLSLSAGQITALTPAPLRPWKATHDAILMDALTSSILSHNAVYTLHQQQIT